MTVLDLIRRTASRYADKPAVICRQETVTYARLLQCMTDCQPLPVPLLGATWESDFTLHTTGSTGAPKAIVVTQEAVIANTENLIAAHGYKPETVFILTGPNDHLGCWSKIFAVLATGGTLVMTDGLRSIDSFYAAIDSTEGPVATFLVPAAIHTLLHYSAPRLASCAPRIDFIETGAAPMPHADKLLLCRLLPAARLYMTYASTETGIIATYNFNDGECIPGCVGTAMPRSSFAITPEGKIACSGDTLCKEWQGRTFVTNDNGHTDSIGRLYIDGRQDDIINVGGYKVSPAEVEDVAMSLPDIADCICIAVPHPVTGHALKLLVQLAPGCATLDKRRIARHINTSLERWKVPMLYEAVTSIARTHNGKLDRKAYRTQP